MSTENKKKIRLIDFDEQLRIFKNYLLKLGYTKLEVDHNFCIPYILMTNAERLLSESWIYRNKDTIHELIDKYFHDIIDDKDDFDRRLGQLFSECFNESTVAIYTEKNENGKTLIEEMVEEKNETTSTN